MNRIPYLDCMRGLTMSLVVYDHLLLFGYHIDGHNLMNGVFLLFRMPLFFWVSGYLAYTSFTYNRLIGGGQIKETLSVPIATNLRCAVPTRVVDRES